MAGEFELIARHFVARAGRRPDVVLGIGDDCALLTVPAGQSLAQTVDTLVEGTHFARAARPADIGYKALAVSLSDLAAMGAEPAWVTLALTLPEADEDWLAGFAQGFFDLAEHHGVTLIGGNTTRGPLAITVGASGFVPHAQALTRSGARPGDLVCVSGTLGDAALALLVRQKGWQPSPGQGAWLDRRLDRPEPRVALGLALRGVATAAIDLSDGLAGDLGHVLAASGVGATLDAERLPLSPALRAYVARCGDDSLALHGGEDYELCCTLPESRQSGLARISADLDLPLTVIGFVETRPGLRLRDPDGAIHAIDPRGYDHFLRDAP